MTACDRQANNVAAAVHDFVSISLHEVHNQIDENLKLESFLYAESYSVFIKVKPSSKERLCPSFSFFEEQRYLS